MTERCFLIGHVKQIELRQVGRDVTLAQLEATTADHDRTFPIGLTMPDLIQPGPTGDVTPSWQSGRVGSGWAKSGLCDISLSLVIALFLQEAKFGLFCESTAGSFWSPQGASRLSLNAWTLYGWSESRHEIFPWRCDAITWRKWPTPWVAHTEGDSSRLKAHARQTYLKSRHTSFEDNISLTLRLILIFLHILPDKAW